MKLKNFKEDENFYFISKQGEESFKYFNVIYTTFSKMHEPTTDDIDEQFSEMILSKDKAGVREYIKGRCIEEWPFSSFKWEQDAYQSNEFNGRNIHVLIDEFPNKKITIDAIILIKEK